MKSEDSSRFNRETNRWGIVRIGEIVLPFFRGYAHTLKTMIASQNDLSSPQDNGAKSAICDYRSSQFGFSEWRFIYLHLALARDLTPGQGILCGRTLARQPIPVHIWPRGSKRRSDDRHCSARPSARPPRWKGVRRRRPARV